MKDEIRYVNLKQGMPYVDEAVSRLNSEIARAKRDHIEALILIHGYGSKGVGGKIRIGVQQELRILEASGNIRAWVSGENWNESNRIATNIIDECPALEDDPDLGAHNAGMSIVLI